jgi:hypothetical protein
MKIQTLLELYGAAQANAVPDWVIKAAVRHVGKRLPAAQIQEVIEIQRNLPDGATVHDFLNMPRVQELVIEVGDGVVDIVNGKCSCGGTFEDDYCIVCLQQRDYTAA